MIFNIIQDIQAQMSEYAETQGAMSKLNRADLQRDLENIVDNNVFNIEDAQAFGADQIEDLIESAKYGQVEDTDFIRTECYRRIPMFIENLMS